MLSLSDRELTADMARFYADPLGFVSMPSLGARDCWSIMTGRTPGNWNSSRS